MRRWFWKQARLYLGGWFLARRWRERYFEQQRELEKAQKEIRRLAK